MQVLDVLIVAIIAMGVVYLTAIIVLSVAPEVLASSADLWRALAQPLFIRLTVLDRAKRLRRLEAGMHRAMGLADAWGSQERAEIVEAALAAQQLTLLNQQMRKTVRQCLAAHWAVAEGLGSPHMGEAARHPWCNGLRQRVIDLSDLLAQRLEEYPLIADSPELMRLHVGIRWVGPTCVTCPYRSSLVAHAPRVCPTAKAFGNEPPTETDCSNDVMDGEIVGGHREESQ